MKYFFLICARSGSKGLKNKNLKKIKNTTLVGWSIRTAKKLKNYARIVVNSNSSRILSIARKEGASFLIKRPEILARSNSKEIDVWKHSINILKEKEEFSKIKFLISLPPTSPCRSAKDVKMCIKKFETRKYDIVICITPSKKNPYFNIVEIKRKNFLKVCISKKKFYNRQEAPITYDITTVCYVADINYIKKAKNILEGRVGYVIVPEERSIDIDTKYDFKIAKKILER